MPETGPGESFERNTSGRESKISLILRSILMFAIFLALLFIPAGRLDWWEGWAFVFAFITSVSVMVVWVNRRDPDLIKERQQPGENVKRWDRIILGIYTVLLLVMLVLASLDSGRFEWSNPPGVLRFLGWVGISAALMIVWWSMASNPFLSKVVRIQDDRGHKVVTTGPYRYVRHPMYDGVILAMLCVPLVLGSLWALIPALLIVILFVVRTALEDRTLMEELPGYEQYAQQVRYRLVPLLW